MAVPAKKPENQSQLGANGRIPRLNGLQHVAVRLYAEGKTRSTVAQLLGPRLYRDLDEEDAVKAMATGSVQLPPLSARMPDGTSSNLACGSTTRQGTQTGLKNHFTTLDFDGAGGLENALFHFRLPADYASGGALKIQWQANSTSAQNCKWQAQVGAVTPADADTVLEHAVREAAVAIEMKNRLPVCVGDKVPQPHGEVIYPEGDDRPWNVPGQVQPRGGLAGGDKPIGVDEEVDDEAG